MLLHFTQKLTKALPAKFFSLLLILLAGVPQLHAQTQECTGFKTFTQGGWGAVPRGGNPGTYLHANFSAAFPSGLVIGCTPGNTLTLTNAQAVTDFVPSGGTADALPAGNLVDPGTSYSNVLAGQLVAATLNVVFDAYDPNFSSNPINTGDLVITTGTFAGWTVNELLEEANKIIGGCSSAYDFSDVNDALTSFNENYDNGTVDEGYTTCQETCNLEVSGITTNVTCNGANDGIIDITVSGNKGVVTYSWSDGSSDGDRSGLAPGEYTVTVTEGNCEASATFTITEPAALSAIEAHTDVTYSGGNDGTIDVTVSGGTAPYTYLWNDGSTDEDRTGLAAGCYSVTITDKNGCSTATRACIEEPKCEIAVTGTVKHNCCFGAAHGEIDITVTGATGNVTYLWNDGATTEDRTGLLAGVYSVTVTDEKGCTATASFAVKQPKKLKATYVKTDATSYTACNGTATVTPVGGTKPYTIVWNDGFSGATRTNLCPGVYTVTVTDKFGCTAVCKIKIYCVAPSAAVATVTDESAAMIDTESLSVAVSPNPTRGLVKVSFSAENSGNAAINVFDMTGKMVQTVKLSAVEGLNVREINLSSRPAGTYHVQVVSGHETKSVKIMLEK